MIRIIGTLIIGLSALGAAWAQTDPEPAPRYTVEMIIFTYTQDAFSAGEVFFPEPLPQETVPGGSTPDIADNAANPRQSFQDVEFRRLQRDELMMGDVMSRLRRLDIYQPVMHFGWTQRTYPEAVTRPIRLSSLGRAPAGLDGTLELYLSRFLHLVVDLEMTAEAGDAAAAFAEPRPVRYRIAEDRIFRSGELRYFDHPKFGVLAQVTRADQQPAADTTELLGYPPE